jgi:uncharacterized protein YukE
VYSGQPRPAAAAPSGGPDGTQLTGRVNGHLDYLSQLSRQLGVTDPVETWLTPALGRWSDLHAEAGRWRTVASTVTEVGQSLRGPLGGLDAAWQGADATSFVDYMQTLGLAGTDLADAATAMADALDKTADGLRQIVTELVDLLAGTAEQASDALSSNPVGGQARAQQCLDDLNDPTSALHESVQTVLAAFVRLCDGLPSGSTPGVHLVHTIPTASWTAPSTTAGFPTAPIQATRVTTQSAVHPVTVTHTPPAAPAAAAPTTAPAAQTAPAAAAGPDPVFSGQLTPPPAAPGGGGGHVSAGDLGGGGAAVPTGGDAGAGLDVASGAQQQHQQQPAAPGAQSGAAVDPAPADQLSGRQPEHPAEPSGQDGQQGGSSMAGMGMGGMRGGQGGGDQEHKSKYRLAGNAKEIFGKPGPTAPPVIGKD